MKCEILAKAAERVMQGWCKESRHNSKGEVCALGAIEDAAGIYRSAENDPLTKPLVIFLASLLPDHYGYRTPTVYRNDDGWLASWKVADWNNDATRTQEEVAQMFRHAADLCRAGAASGTTDTQVQAEA